MEGDALLLEIVGARSSATGFAGCLYGRQQQSDQNADDRDHDQQFYERKRRCSYSRSRQSEGLRNGKTGNIHGKILLEEGMKQFTSQTRTLLMRFVDEVSG